MDNRLIDYPRSLRDADQWAQVRGIQRSEARARFAAAGVLEAIASSRPLREELFFKGGNALNFVWCPNRSTTDLDFSCRDEPFSMERLRELLDTGLHAASRRLGTTYSIQQFKRQPPGPDKTFVTYEVSVGYALADDQRNRKKMHNQQPSHATVKLDISINEIVCDFSSKPLPSGHSVHVCTLEDIVAEKYRALLQQKERNRQRPQDVLDIAVILRSGDALRPDFIARFLQAKAAARDIPVHAAALDHPEIRLRAAAGYSDLENTAHRFIPFDEAFALVLDYFHTLPLPHSRYAE
jgi:predicted nucleotidyltransferase component of viral defense system